MRIKQKVCLIGSLRFYDEMLEIANLLANQGVPILIPTPGKYRKNTDPGHYISAYNHIPHKEKVREEGRRVHAHLEKIIISDLIYIVNPGGYVGFNTAVEICFAYTKGKHIYAMEAIRDRDSLFLMNFVERTLPPEELLTLVTYTNSATVLKQPVPKKTL